MLFRVGKLIWFTCKLLRVKLKSLGDIVRARHSAIGQFADGGVMLTAFTWGCTYRIDYLVWVKQRHILLNGDLLRMPVVLLT